MQNLVGEGSSFDSSLKEPYAISISAFHTILEHCIKGKKNDYMWLKFANLLVELMAKGYVSDTTI